MASTYPTTIDNFTNPTPTSDTAAVSHSGQHSDTNDAIEALEAKVGANSSAVTTSHDYKLSGVTGTDKAVSKTGTEVLTNKTLSTASKVLLGGDTTGDMYYNGGSGTLTRLPLGSAGQVLISTGTIPAFASPSSANLNYITDTGAVNALVATLVPAITSYAAGQLVQVKVAVTNTGTTTINVNGLGVKTIKKGNGAADLVAGDIVAGQVISLEYDGTNFQLQSPVANLPVGINQTFFGDGSDGDVTIGSNTTLTRDMFYNNLTISSTFTLNTANYKVFVKGTLTNNGTIANNGVAGGNGAANTVGTGGAAPASGTLLKAADGGSGLTFNINGGPGGGGSGAGVVYLAANTIAVEGVINAIGGAGGAGQGGQGSSGANGNGGNANTIITTGSGGTGGNGNGFNQGTAGAITSSKLNALNPINLNLMFDTVLIQSLTGGAGGSGGGASGSGAGGGGGGMGGVIVEIYKTLTTSGTKSVAGGAAGSSSGTSSAATAGSAGRIVTLQLI